MFYSVSSTAKEPVQRGKAPQHQTPLTSPGSSKIISVTEEVFETVETKPGSKRTRQHVDNFSAPEYFTKGQYDIVGLDFVIYLLCQLLNWIALGSK